MAFELKPGQRLGKGIARLARQQMATALEELTGKAGDSRDEAVHEARKCFKKIRAILRLARGAIGSATFQRENACFRDAGRPLTEVRDAKILVETLDKLTDHFAERVRGHSFNAVRKELQANRQAVRKRVLDQQHALAGVAAAVREACERVEDWADVPDRWGSLQGGLERVYRQAREAYAGAADDPSVENLHEWRKQSKYLRYQLEILSPLWRVVTEALAEQADQLGELLGDDHDLAVLRGLLTDDAERFGDATTRELLLALIDRRRADLQRQAFALGRRLLQDRPADFTRRLRGYWKAWRTESAQEQADAPQAVHA